MLAHDTALFQQPRLPRRSGGALLVALALALGATLSPGLHQTASRVSTAVTAAIAPLPLSLDPDRVPRLPSVA